MNEYSIYMQLFIHVKQLGKRKEVIENIPLTLDPVPETTAGLIAAVVTWQVHEYNERLEQSELLKYLTKEEIEVKSETGKVGFGVNYSGVTADVEKAVSNALQSFEDGIFRVFVEDRELQSLDEVMQLKEGAKLTFIRLTMLAGRIW